MGRADNTNERENYKPPFYLFFFLFFYFFFLGDGRPIILVGFTILTNSRIQTIQGFSNMYKSQEK